MEKISDKILFGLLLWATYYIFFSLPTLPIKAPILGFLFSVSSIYGIFIIYPMIIFGLPFLAAIFTKAYFKNHPRSIQEGFQLGFIWVFLGFFLGVIYRIFTTNDIVRFLGAEIVNYWFIVMNALIFIVCVFVSRGKNKPPKENSNNTRHTELELLIYISSRIFIFIAVSAIILFVIFSLIFGNLSRGYF